MRKDLGVELAALADHLDEFTAAELEVDVLIIAEHRGVICGSVFESLVNVTVEDGCAYAC